MELLKRVWAVVKPFKAQDVVEALAGFDSVEDLCLSECRGYGRQKGHLDMYRDEPDRVSFLPKVRLECAVPADRVDEAVESVSTAARTGRIGDGKIFVGELE